MGLQTSQNCPSCKLSKMVKHIIVHPAFAHTLPERESLKSPVQLHGLPLPILHLIASKLDKAKDLCSFEQVCTLGW